MEEETAANDNTPTWMIEEEQALQEEHDRDRENRYCLNRYGHDDFGPWTE